MDVETSQPERIVSGRSSRFAAMQMDIGNLISMLLPPLPLLWFGGSMLVYALHRHHPNPRVGYYTQRAAYRFYAVMGAWASPSSYPGHCGRSRASAAKTGRTWPCPKHHCPPRRPE